MSTSPRPQGGGGRDSHKRSGSSGGAPFEWLSGGLFFGKGGKTREGAIESCSDVASLLGGMVQDLDAVAASSPGKDGSMAMESSSTPTVETDNATAISPSESRFATLARRLSRTKLLLYEERRVPPKLAATTVASSVIATLSSTHPNLIPRLLLAVQALPFESRKDVASIFNYLLVCGFDGVDAQRYQPVMLGFASYVESYYEEIVGPIVAGHNCGASAAAAVAGGSTSTPDVALHCGSMLRSTLRHPSLYRQLVSPEHTPLYVYPFLDTFVHLPNFDVSSDALETLRLILTGGFGFENENAEAGVETASDASAFLEREYESIIEQRFNPRLLGGVGVTPAGTEGNEARGRANYLTRRMALQLLSTVLLTRSNYAIMIRYISSRSNLRLVMCLLRDPSPHITLDAFHVFKIFVANPNKPPDVIKILMDNKVKLCRYLETLHKEREVDDEQFRDEKALVITTLESL